MKKLYSTLVIALLSVGSYAQPVINSTNVSSTINANIIQADASGSSYGSAGGGQTWNYSSVTTLAYGTEQVIPFASSPFASTFTTCNYCNKLNISGFGTSYDYYKLTTSSFEKFSETWDGGSGITYTNQRTVIQFPATFNSTFTDSYQQTGASSATSFTATYDAYGTMILSFGTFTNVIRQKIVEGGITNYKWFNSNPFYLLVETNVINSEFKIYQNTSTGISENSDDIGFTVSPNPASDQTTITFSEAGSTTEHTIKVMNTLGECIQQLTTSNKQLILDMSGYAKGVYFVRIENPSLYLPQEETKTVYKKLVLQ